MITALPGRGYQHEAKRSSVDTKNILLMGLVTAKQIFDVLKRFQGQDHQSPPHSQAPSIEVHIIQRDGWYMKFYFVDPDTVFISVHQ